jgi:hypothetical protein
MLMELEHITTILLRVEDPLPELEFQYWLWRRAMDHQARMISMTIGQPVEWYYRQEAYDCMQLIWEVKAALMLISALHVYVVAKKFVK